MTTPVTIPGDVVARFVDIGVHLIEVFCIAIITWLVYIGKKEFFEAVEKRARTAASVQLVPILKSMEELRKWDTEHEQLDEQRHDELMVLLKRRPSAMFGD